MGSKGSGKRSCQRAWNLKGSSCPPLWGWSTLRHPLYYKKTVDVLRGVAEAETDDREGLRSLELLFAGYRSARDGQTVSLPLEY